MSIVPDSEILDFLGISTQLFTITAANDVINLRTGVPTVPVDIPDGTYDGTTLATAVQSAINTAFAGSPTFTVTYSLTTFKFTITPSAGSVSYIHTASDAGYTLGLNQSHIGVTSITSDFACGNPGETALDIRNAVEEWIQKVYCRRTFESASYKERYDGSGTQYLMLKNIPITALSRISIGTVDVMEVKNSSQYTSASISVGSSGITLYKDDVEDTSIIFATYQTMTAVATAINALGNGWSASVVNSVYNNYKSSELIEVMGLNCLWSESAYLQVPDVPERDFSLDPLSGGLCFDFRVPKGTRNVFVRYVAGYSSSTMPDDLKLAVKILSKQIFQKQSEESFGVSSYTIGDYSVTFEDSTKFEIPAQVLSILGGHRRVLL